MKNTLKIFFLLTIFFSLQVISQSKEGLKIQAEQQLQTMSPEEIDAAIKKYGLTREEADAKAKSLGIDLETF